MGQIDKKNYQFWRFLYLYAHIFKAITVKFGVRVRTWDTLPAPNFLKIAQSFVALGQFFYQTIEILAILSHLSPLFYTHNVEILLKRTDLGIHQRHKISSKSLKKLNMHHLRGNLVPAGHVQNPYCVVEGLHGPSS